MVEEMTGAHLKMLEFFADPKAWFESRGLDKGNIYMGGQASILELGIPEFAGKRDWYDLLAGDLTRMQAQPLAPCGHD